MEEDQTMDISEKELIELLESMPDNVIVQVIFGKEEKDGKGK